MCGICGKVFFDQEERVERDLLVNMCQTLAHRGPDGEGIYSKGQVGLGHRRLAIIDITQAGRQPMSNEDDSLWISFNGEIYNFQLLREELLKKGHRFRSRTDTEVILHLYEEEGFECVRRLRGMFAFAIWDEKRKSLFLARDRLGQKPLFYCVDDKSFLFASEPKAILQDPEIRAEPDLRAIHHYLTYGYVPAPASAFRGIRKLLPGHYLILKGRDLSVRRYWNLSYAKKHFEGERPGAEEKLSQELLEHLREAVRLRLVSDVPLGAFLSGGVDSSTIVALMSEMGSAPVKTFSVGFEEKDYSELEFARVVSKRFGTDHHEFVVKPDALEILPQLTWHYNEPFADSSAIATYYLAKLTREHVTVALSGDAGDENFAGYDRYLATKLARFSDKLPSAIRRILGTAGELLPDSICSRSLPALLKRFLSVLNEEPRRRYGRLIDYFSNPWKDELYTQEFRHEMEGIDSMDLLIEAYESSDATDFVDATLNVDVQTYLPNDLLTKVDIASMVHSLEARSPLLDHPLVEFAASIPSQLKLKGRIQKYILKKSLQDLLPQSVVHRPKMGFSVPIEHWFRRELRDMAYDLLLDRKTMDRGYFRREVVTRILDEHCSGKVNWHYQLWNLLMLELWYRMFIDHPPSRAGT